MTRRTLFLLLSILFLQCEDPTPNASSNFRVTIQNLSSGEIATDLSKGIFLIKNEGFPLYFTGAQDYGQGEEQLAEDGYVTRLVENLQANDLVLAVDSFDLIPPGESISFEFNASYGAFLNFATMFTDSNDLFYSFNDDGILLFNPDGSPRKGDVTSLVWLWDLGTEINEPPYEGIFQAASQSAPNEGEDENSQMRLVNDGFTYPPRTSVIQVTVNPI